MAQGGIWTAATAHRRSSVLRYWFPHAAPSQPCRHSPSFDVIRSITRTALPIYCEGDVTRASPSAVCVLKKPIAFGLSLWAVSPLAGDQHAADIASPAIPNRTVLILSQPSQRFIYVAKDLPSIEKADCSFLLLLQLTHPHPHGFGAVMRCSENCLLSVQDHLIAYGFRST